MNRLEDVKSKLMTFLFSERIHSLAVNESLFSELIAKSMFMLFSLWSEWTVSVNGLCQKILCAPLVLKHHLLSLLQALSCTEYLPFVPFKSLSFILHPALWQAGWPLGITSIVSLALWLWVEFGRWGGPLLVGSQLADCVSQLRVRRKMVSTQRKGGNYCLPFCLQAWEW